MALLNNSPLTPRPRRSYGGVFLLGVTLLTLGVCVLSLFTSQLLQRALLGSPLFAAAHTPAPATALMPLAALPHLDLEHSTLNGLHMVSAGEGWIVGENSGYALILRYHDGHWLPEPLTVAGGSLRAVAFADARHGWAVGSQPLDAAASSPIPSTPTLASQALILRYQDGHWLRLIPPRAIIGTLTAIRLVAADDWWALNYQGEASVLNLVHYTRGAWSLLPLPSQVTDAHGLAVAGPDDVWVGVAGGVVHVHGETVEQPASGINANLLALDLRGPRDGWAVGLTFCGAASATSPVCDQRIALYHFDGAAWSPVATDVHGELDAMAMTSDGEVWAAGSTMNKAGRGSLIVHYQNGQWQPSSTTFAIDLIGLSMAGSAEGWAIGYAQSADGTRNAPGLLHYRDGAWTQAQLG